jgi:Protein of unknown function (DUF3150)
MNIFKDGLLIDVNVSFWSGAKILKAEDLGLKEESIASAYKLGRKMLIPIEVIREFRSIEDKARHIVETNSFKFPIGNARFIPKKKFPKVSDALKKCKEDYTALTEKLVENYDKYRDEMLPVYQEAAEVAFVQQEPTGVQEFSLEDKDKQKEVFIREFMGRIQSYYPTAESLRARFALQWDVYEIALPKLKKGEDASIIDDLTKNDIYEQEYRAQTQQKIGAFVEEVVKTLRQETLDICSRVVMNIKEGKVVNGRTLTSLRNFIDKFQELNFIGDSSVESQLEKLKTEFLDVHSTNDISKEDDLQEELSRRIDELAEVASNTTDINTVTGEYNRRIAWD